ncbi:hypothetical protein D9M72_509420 [compost metagenome]
MALLAPIAESQRDVVGESLGAAGLEADVGVADECSKRIGFKQETVLGRALVLRIGDGDLGERCAVDLFEEEMQQRLVGAPQRRLHAEARKLLFRRLAAGGIVEEPGFELGAAGRFLAVGGEKGIERALEGAFENRRHREVLPVGSRLSRSQSPRRLRPRTVSRIARPGKTLTHQAFCR